MSHNRIQKQLSAYLDDQLSPANRERVEAHLSICDECAETLSDFQRNRQGIGALRHEAPPIAELVMPQLSDRGAVRRSFLPNMRDIRQWFFRPLMGGAFAVASACLLFGLVYFNLTPTSDDSLNLYLSEHTQHSVYYSSQAEGAADTLDPNATTTPTTVEEDTSYFLDVYLGG